jgi:solute carrier family 45 protein 1/2/4
LQQMYDITLVLLYYCVSGLLLVPNGKDLGKLMGDKYYETNIDPPFGRLTEDETPDGWGDESYEEADLMGNLTTVSYPTPPPDLHTYHPWGIFFTIIGTVLLDFDADACQSPSRANLLDVTLLAGWQLG